ncbi:ARP4 [Scenedesmus sp. PABB004]|nr:ARP4 [Scenedesmus sp. PABB004]
MAAIYGGDEVNAVVLDLGTWQTKAGYAGDDTPKAVFPSLAGVVGGDGASGMEVDGAEGGGGRRLYLGSQELGYRRPGMDVVSPFNAEGLLEDWEATQRIWEYALKDRLMVDPKENAVLLAEPTHNSRAVREKTVQAAFEHLGCPALFLAKDAVLATFSVAKQTGVVVDAGYDATTVAGVHDGYVLTKSISRSPVGGRLLNSCLRAALEARGVVLRPRQTFKRVEKKGAPGEYDVVDVDSADLTPGFLAHQTELIVGDIKELVSRVSDVHFVEADNLTVPAITYELPDGNEIQVGVDRFKVPELLFQPQLVRTFPGMAEHALPEGAKGLAGLVVDSVNRCDTDVRKDLYQHVVLAGGTSLLAQMRERLELDISTAAPGGTKVKVTAPVNPTERRHAVWIGGSILASLGSFQQMWLSKQEYEEHGAGLIHRKAP